MTVVGARVRAGLLIYASIQFVVLTAIAMYVYADPYRFLVHFFSDLGGTHAWSGRSNRPSMVLFSVALTTLGVAFIAFAGTWRAYACERRGVTIAGVIAEGFGTLSGLAFIAVAFMPVDVRLAAHNTFVVAAFALLIGYSVAMTVVWACDGRSRALVVANATFLLLVLVYVGVAIAAVKRGPATIRGRELLVVSQKIFAYVSMLYIVVYSLAMRRLSSPVRSQ